MAYNSRWRKSDIGSTPSYIFNFSQNLSGPYFPNIKTKELVLSDCKKLYDSVNTDSAHIWDIVQGKAGQERSNLKLSSRETHNPKFNHLSNEHDSGT